MQHKTVFGLIVAATLLTKTWPAMAAGALAAGVPSDVAEHGLALYVWVNEATIDQAKVKALDGCKTIPHSSNTSKALCKVVATFSNQCAAEALDPQDGTPGYGWAIADTSKAAKEQALANCRDTAGPTRQDACVVPERSLWCDGRAK